MESPLLPLLCLVVVVAIQVVVDRQVGPLVVVVVMAIQVDRLREFSSWDHVVVGPRQRRLGSILAIHHMAIHVDCLGRILAMGPRQRRRHATRFPHDMGRGHRIYMVKFEFPHHGPGHRPHSGPGHCQLKFEFPHLASCCCFPTNATT